MHRLALAACATAVTVAVLAPLLVAATQPDMPYQRRAYRHNVDLRRRLNSADVGIPGGKHALKPRYTPPPTIAPIDDVDLPNTNPGIDTSDNAYVTAPDTYTEDAGCTAYYAVEEGDTCNAILEAHPDFDTSLDLFYSMNPSVDGECTNLVPGLAYCIGLATPASVAPQTKTVEDGCIRYQLIKKGDFCLSVVQEHQYVTGLTLDSFYQANPMLDSICSNLWLGYSYCVGLAGAVVEEAPMVVGDEDCPLRRRSA